MLTRADWHQRYREQAGWTQAARQYLYQRAGIEHAARVLEVGCGTGAVAADLHGHTPARVFGIDLRRDDLAFAGQNDPGSHYCTANALALPFPGETFDAVLCHFFLLWVGQPEQAVAEMVRAVRPGGYVLAAAEPDYGGRIDYPAGLARLGKMQTEELERQGADPFIGRKLAALLHGAGLDEVEVGLLGGEWPGSGTPQGWEMEWKVLFADLAGRAAAEELERLKEADRLAWETGERILFVPTFYGMGRKV